jgi:hypothetical protein
MNFKTKGGHRGFKVLGCRPLYNKHDPDDDHFDNFIIDGDLYGLIYSYYKAHPDPKIQIETRPEDLAANGEWNDWEPMESGQPRQKKQSRAPPAPPANRIRVEPAPTAPPPARAAAAARAPTTTRATRANLPTQAAAKRPTRGRKKK